MKKIKSYLVILTISIVSYSCLPVPAHATPKQLVTLYATINSAKTSVPQLAMKVDTHKLIKNDSLQKVTVAPAPPAPDSPTWLDKVFKLLKWVVPGLIILLRIIPTSKNVDIIALLNWLLDTLIPNLTQTTNGLETHTTTPVVAHRTFVGKIIGSIFGT